MNPPLEFRLASDLDLPLLAEMNGRLIAHEGNKNPMTLSELTDRMHSWLQKDHQAVIFTQLNQPVAYSLFCFGEQFDQPFVFIRHFFVESHFRRQGIGRQAFQILRNSVWPPGTRLALDVLTHNTNARAFWCSLGFKEHSVTLVSP